MSSFITAEFFGERLKDLLERTGYKQSELSEKTGYTKNAINNICKGRNLPSFDCAVTIAKALNVSLDYFVEENLSKTISLDDVIECINKNILMNKESLIHQKDGKLNYGNNVKNFTEDRFTLMNGLQPAIHHVVCYAYPNLNRIYPKNRYISDDKIANKEHEYIIANGNIYTKEYYYECLSTGDNEIGETSIYNFVNMQREDDYDMKSYIRNLKRAYNRERYNLGYLGLLSADKFYWCNYIIGYYYSKVIEKK